MLEDVARDPALLAMYELRNWFKQVFEIARKFNPQISWLLLMFLLGRAFLVLENPSRIVRPNRKSDWISVNLFDVAVTLWILYADSESEAFSMSPRRLSAAAMLRPFSASAMCCRKRACIVRDKWHISMRMRKTESAFDVVRCKWGLVTVSKRVLFKPRFGFDSDLMNFANALTN